MSGVFLRILVLTGKSIALAPFLGVGHFSRILWLRSIPYTHDSTTAIYASSRMCHKKL